MELFLYQKISLIKNSERNDPEGVLMGILGGNVPPVSPNPNPSYFRPCNFPHPPVSRPGARFSKLPVITGPVKLFCFPFSKEVLKVLKIIQ